MLICWYTPGKPHLPGYQHISPQAGSIVSIFLKPTNDIFFGCSTTTSKRTKSTATPSIHILTAKTYSTITERLSWVHSHQILHFHHHDNITHLTQRTCNNCLRFILFLSRSHRGVHVLLPRHIRHLILLRSEEGQAQAGLLRRLRWMVLADGLKILYGCRTLGLGLLLDVQ